MVEIIVKPTPVSRIVLYGSLKRKFGHEFHLGVPTVAAAIRALCVLLPGFEREFSAGQYHMIRGPRRTGIFLDEQMVDFRLNGADLHVIPLAAGAGGGVAESGRSPLAW
jgi:predicted phage tail protein